MPKTRVIVSIDGADDVQEDVYYHHEADKISRVRAKAEEIGLRGVVHRYEDGSGDEIYFPPHRIQSVTWNWSKNDAQTE